MGISLPLPSFANGAFAVMMFSPEPTSCVASCLIFFSEAILISTLSVRLTDAGMSTLKLVSSISTN